MQTELVTSEQALANAKQHVLGILISKRTGKVVYEGSASDEG